MPTTQNITLCCVDTEHNALSALALRQCNQHMRFAKTVFITDSSDHVDKDWEHHRIKTFDGYEDYNRFMLKGLHYHIETEYVLSVQFDGFIINPGAWSDEFLQYDYIGGPWPSLSKPYTVGNGGFSLRSRRLLKALQDDRIALPTAISANEDLSICRTYRSLLETHYGIRFAPVEIAERFSYESGPLVPGTFGFHGLVLVAQMYQNVNATFLIDNLKPYLLRREQVLWLAV